MLVKFVCVLCIGFCILTFPFEYVILLIEPRLVSPTGNCSLVRDNQLLVLFLFGSIYRILFSFKYRYKLLCPYRYRKSSR